MKKSRFLIVVGVVVAAAIMASWMLRNSIIRELSGPLLAKYDLEIIDVSLDALATADAAIGHIELRHASGMTIAIDELNLGVRKSVEGRRAYSAESVTITLPASSDDTPLNVAELIRQAVRLPGSLPLIDVAVTELVATGYPVVSDLAWSTYDDRQLLDARIEEDVVRLELERRALNRYEARVEFATGRGTAQRLPIYIEDMQDLIRLRTDTALQLAAFEYWLERLQLLPDKFDIESAAAAIELLVDIPVDPLQPLQLDAAITLGTEWRFRYDDDTAFVLAVPDGLNVSMTFPGNTWQARTAGARILMTSEDIGEVIISLSDLDCHTGITCAAEASASTGPVTLPSFSARTATASAELQVNVGTDGRLMGTAAPGATLALTGIAVGDSQLAALSADFASAIDVFRDATGWQLAAQSIDARVDRVVAGNITANSSLFLDKASIESTSGDIFARTGVFAQAVDVAYEDFQARLPGVRGTVEFKDQRISARLKTVGLEQDGQVRASHNLSSGRGTFSVDGLVSTFTDRPFSSLVFAPRPAFDLTSGTLGIDLRVDWRPRRPLRGPVSVRLVDLGGFYNATAFTGVSTTVDFDFDGDAGIKANPSDLSAELVDVGVPLTEIEAQYQLHLDTSSVDISTLRLAAFGATITADPFSLGTGGEPDNVWVHVKSLDIAEVLTIKEFEAVTVTGRVDAELPMTIGPNGVTIDGGRLTGVPPGGVIRYAAGDAGTNVDATAMGIAARALSNFRYESLTADVDYTAAGDLVLQMQLNGRNPEMEDSRPIVLNLGVENNVPDMLRSLQASRSVQEVLERRAIR